MGAPWTSWRTTITIIITATQIPALVGVRSTAVSGVDGQTFHFECEYPRQWTGNAKYLCRVDDNDNYLIRTDVHNQWESDGRFSLFDNTSAAVFLVQVDRLVPEDSGAYWCGVDVSVISVIVLNVSRVKERPNVPPNLTIDKLNMPLFLTAVMCAAAILFVGLFILCLLQAVAVKGQRSRPPHHRETSSDYEIMTLGACHGPDHGPDIRCTCSLSGLVAPSGPLPPPPDLCSHIRPDSAVNEYTDVNGPAHCHYQHLDISQVEEQVYQKIHRPKRGPLQMKS